jgi:DNA repair protein RecO (recombination protein O)
MQRSISTQAIVIRRERYGEFHKSLALLTADLGLISATAYGAYKMNSSLRMGSEPFTWCLARLYHNPVKRTYKVTDLEISDSFPGLQQEVSTLAAASLWAEVVQKSYGAGETSSVLFHLFLDSLRLLSSAGRREPYVSIQFLWRFLSLAGYQPDTGVCDHCGAPFGESKSVRWSAQGNSFLCQACGADQAFVIPAGCLRYLDATQSMSMDAALAVSMDAASLDSLRALLPRMVQGILEGELASLRWAGAAR